MLLVIIRSASLYLFNFRAGGGKGIIAAPKGNQHLEPSFRTQAYMDFGEFLTSLNGCFSM